MASPARVTANQINALNSTGPTSPEGKQRASLNAFKHGFTGQTLVVPESEAPAYQSHCAEYQAELRPKGKLEVDLVQEMADLRWSVNRIRACETNLLTLAAVDGQLSVDSGDAEINSALAIAASMAENAKILGTLSLYEQRKLRAFEKAERRLREMQHERRHYEEKDLERAAQFRRTVAKNDKNWNPADDGFVCSNAQIDAYERYHDRKMQANSRGGIPPR